MIASTGTGAIARDVPTTFHAIRRACRTSLIALTLVSATGISATSVSDHDPGASTEPVTEPATVVAPVPAPPQAWWRETGDPVLATLVEQGLAANPEMTCSLAVFLRAETKAQADSRSFGRRLGQLLGTKPDPAVQAAHDARVLRIVGRRTSLAERIALAYVDLRRLQVRAALRGAVIEQYKDNAEIAEFRRQAGLVPAIDGALARSQDEVAHGELGLAEDRVNEAIMTLAQLVAQDPAVLAGQLAGHAALPEPGGDPLASLTGDDPRRAVLADAVLRETRLSQALDRARTTARDARNAYREGAGNFATLYVAEVAALSVEQALTDARAERIAATIRLWSTQQDGWARADLDQPSASPTNVQAECD